MKALFAGPLGTGKTITAQMMARELRLDLYKADLSTVVTKYIGETKKNTDRIFGLVRIPSIELFQEPPGLVRPRKDKRGFDRISQRDIPYQKSRRI